MLREPLTQIYVFLVVLIMNRNGSLPLASVISRKRLDAIRLCYLNYGLSTRIHSNVNHLHHNRYTTEELIYTVTFIINCAETHVILLLGRIPGYKIDVLFLLTHMT